MWRKGDTEINGAEKRFQVNVDTEQNIYSLVITNAQIEDAGIYLVTATNIAGVSKAIVKITVEEEASSSEEESLEESSSSALSSEESKDSLEPEPKKNEPASIIPTISVIKDTISVKAGACVKIACKVTGKYYKLNTHTTSVLIIIIIIIV